MGHDHKDIKAKDSRDELKMANERRVEELLNINNRYVRTQRHLEQYSNISNPDNLRHARKIQEEREEEMENLKDIIAYGRQGEDEQVDNIESNLQYTDGYLDNHASRMDEFTLDKSMEKQSHRREQLEFLED